MNHLIRERRLAVSRRVPDKILSPRQVLELRAALRGRKVALCFGGGVDSTGLLVALKVAGVRPDVITFADTAGEKKLTYRHIDRMQEVLLAWDFPPIDVVRKRPLASTGYTTLEGNCIKNETLPSLAFGMKSCSIKWKQEPQDQFLKGVKSGPNERPPHSVWITARAKGERMVKLLGYDSGPADLRRSKGLREADANFDFLYPLQLIGWKRHDCVRAIVVFLGPDFVPIKSACFYCPASKIWELYWLAAHEPDRFEDALFMERNALTGRHSRFDELYFGDTWENLVRNASSFPSSDTSVGLGRSFSWNQWALVNGVVDQEFRVKRHLAAQFAAKARELAGQDNALDSRSCSLAA